MWLGSTVHDRTVCITTLTVRPMTDYVRIQPLVAELEQAREHFDAFVAQQHTSLAQLRKTAEQERVAAERK